MTTTVAEMCLLVKRLSQTSSSFLPWDITSTLVALHTLTCPSLHVVLQAKPCLARVTWMTWSFKIAIIFFLGFGYNFWEINWLFSPVSVYSREVQFVGFQKKGNNEYVIGEASSSSHHILVLSPLSKSPYQGIHKNLCDLFYLLIYIFLLSLGIFYLYASIDLIIFKLS